ncbi:uncharacterized protein LOC123560340 [Mercenaria mercenaria]|uniref:uncharacterized protein LOC123560340 n=1 Tax=Mercenaria mercenaria TaxID=6596 RepID=UPI001E1D7C7C|nr:uncharacterized protein LOC123560340 [Mercenaria mercenaria]
MHHIISVLLCLMASCVASKAWYNRYDNAVYGGGWAPDRRSFKRCTETGGGCIKNHQCCSNLCIIDNTSKFGFGLCKSNILDAYLPNSEFGYKKKNQECIDSIECADQCCRPTRMGRYGKKLTCGKPEENTACIGRVFSKNDIFNGY